MKKFFRKPLAVGALLLFSLLFLLGLYAPFFASSKPLVVLYEDRLYFPLFRYLFYPGFFTRAIDLFYNLLMFTLPLGLILIWLIPKAGRKVALGLCAALHCALFALFASGFVKDPANDLSLALAKQEAMQNMRRIHDDRTLFSYLPTLSWEFELGYLTPYERLNLLLRTQQREATAKRLKAYEAPYLTRYGTPFPTLFELEKRHEEEEIARLSTLLDQSARLKEVVDSNSGEAHEAYGKRRAMLSKLHYLKDRRLWLETETEKLTILVPTLWRSLHWEDDAGGEQRMNAYLPWWELTRLSHKDLVASLLFGIRVSLVVGVLAVALSLSIGIPLGLLGGYFGGKVDLLLCRWIEVWEGMPTFLMLLLIVAIVQIHSLFLVILVLGLFGWTANARFLRAEVLRQRALPYVKASTCLGFSNRRIMFSHILPNAIPPVLTLLPFSMMAAITSEAGLSFLGLGEPGSPSWGVLMDEGRSVFPGESNLLWPPALLLTLLLVSIALIGDGVRDTLDPRSN